MQWPQYFKASFVNSDLVSNIDLSATFLQVAGIQLPSNMESHPIFDSKAQKRGYIIATCDRIEETTDRMRAVRSKQLKYIKNHIPERLNMQPNLHRETELLCMEFAEGIKSTNQTNVYTGFVYSPNKTDGRIIWYSERSRRIA